MSTDCSIKYSIIDILTQILQNQFIQEWRGLKDNSSNCNNYRIFKTKNFNLEKYMLILPRDLPITFTKLPVTIESLQKQVDEIILTKIEENVQCVIVTVLGMNFFIFRMYTFCQQ